MPVNVLYLTGFRSSNAALLVDDERGCSSPTFATRRRGAGSTRSSSSRSSAHSSAGSPAHVEGRMAFERTHLTYANWEVLRDAGVELVPRRRLDRATAGRQGGGRAELIRRATEITNEAYARLARGAVRGSHRARPRVHLRAVHPRARRTRRGLPKIVASGPNGATPHAGPSDRVVEKGETVVVDAGALVDGYALRLHAHVRDRPAPRRARARVRRRARGAARRARRGRARA